MARPKVAIVSDTHRYTVTLAIAHSPDRLSSNGSDISTLTLGDTYEEILGCPISTSELVKDAKETIRRKAANTTIRHPTGRVSTRIRVNDFLLAMLKYAVEDSGKRYAACTILATKSGDESLEDVASKWLYNLIFPCKPHGHLT